MPGEPGQIVDWDYGFQRSLLCVLFISTLKSWRQEGFEIHRQTVGVPPGYVVVIAVNNGTFTKRLAGASLTESSCEVHRINVFQATYSNFFRGKHSWLHG